MAQKIKTHGILIKILGTPRSQPRGRAVGEGDNKRIVSVIDKKTLAWIASVRYAVQSALRDMGGIKVAESIIGKRSDILSMKSVFRIPTKDKSRWGTLHSQANRYDLDNLEKLIMDTMTGKRESPLGSDDSRIAHKEGVKIWSRPEDAGCIVRLAKPLPVDEILRRMME